MAIVGFICPDGQKVTLEDCFRDCRLKNEFPTGRCKALPFLKRAGKDRQWDGKLSSTQVTTGTREIFLKITKPYFISPARKVAAIIGTNVHNIMYRLTNSKYAEETLYNELIQGTYDIYDPETQTLYDYKTWGAWKIVKAISSDPAERADALFEVTVQLNQYRVLLKEKYPDLKISTMAVQIISREAGLKYTKQKGIFDSAPVISVPEIEDRLIERFQTIKVLSLQRALSEEWAPLCRPRETWNGKKCSEYCDVSDICVSLKTEGDLAWWAELETELMETEKKILEVIKDYNK